MREIKFSLFKSRQGAISVLRVKTLNLNKQFIRFYDSISIFDRGVWIFRVFITVIITLALQ